MLAVEDGILHSNGKIPVACGGEVQKDKHDQREAKRCILDEATCWDKEHLSHVVTTEKSQVLEAEGRKGFQSPRVSLVRGAYTSSLFYITASQCCI